MAHRSPTQRELQRRIEALIAVAAPALDLLLFAGDKLSRVAGRHQIDPEPPRLGSSPPWPSPTPNSSSPGRRASASPPA